MTIVAALLVGAVIGVAAALTFLVPPPPEAPPAPPPPVVEAPPQETAARYTPVPFDSLPGWQEDSTAQALPALKRSCARLKSSAPDRIIGNGEIARPASAWHAACERITELSGGDGALRSILANQFMAYRVADVTGGQVGEDGIFTGYYEADLRGSLQREGPYQVPIYGVPRNLVSVDVRDFTNTADALPAGTPTTLVGRVIDTTRGRQMKPFFTRQEIDAAHAIASDADVLVWADDPVAVHILHIQGSGRASLPDGTVMRVGFAGSNGLAFKGIGSILLEAGALRSGGASMIAVRDWLTAHPDEAAKYMNMNTRYIFFRKVDAAEVEDGPLGATNVSLTPGRSLAVDPRYIPLGAPLWLDTKDPDGLSLQRLMVAQDTGSAIKGVVRGDFFWGHGEDAFLKAARMRSTGSYVVLIPKGPQAPASPTTVP